jgi:hypothetical protein
MKLLTAIILFVGISFSAICGNIVYPWRATTAIIKDGESFEVWYNASSGQTVNSIHLKSEFLTINTGISSLTGNWTYDPVSGNTYNTKITVTVPADTPADRYDLLLNTSTGPETSYGGVKVVKDFKSEYYVVHISDGHIYQSGYDSDVLLQRKSLIIQMSDIMDAEILIETGDNMYNIRNNPHREVEYFVGKNEIGSMGVSKAKAATFAVPGNHDAPNGNDFSKSTDQENSAYINQYWGLQSHSFKYGSARFMMLNNAWGLSATNNKVFQYQVDDAIAWLNGAGSGGTFLLSAGHMYDRMHHFINNVHPLNLCLSGHRHSMGNENPWEITPGGPRISYTCNDLRGGMKYMIYRVNNSTGTFSLPAGGTGLIEAIAGGDKNIPSTWVPRLKSTFASTNDGTVSTNSVTIENKFPFPIVGGKIRFLVPKGGSYAPTNGLIIQEFDGENVRVVDVTFDVAANSSTTVYIAAGDPIDLCPDDPDKLVPGLCGCGVPEGSCEIPVTSVAIGQAVTKLNLHVTKQLTANILPTTATNKNVDWQSSNTEVATVSSDGFVVAVGGGTATITATTQSENKSASTNVIVNPSTTVYPAEDAELAGVLVVNNQPGYYGEAFADFTNMSNDYIKWTVYAPEDEDYNLSFRYALMSNSRPLRLTINDEIKIPSIDFPITGSWSNWLNYNTIQPLVAGNNTITLTAIGSSGGNFDELVISKVFTGMKNPFSNTQEQSIHIYPNPFNNGKLSIDMVGFENSNCVEVKIVNITGQTVFQKSSTNTSHIELNTSGLLQKSVYFISVESKQTKAISKLLVN